MAFAVLVLTAVSCKKDSDENNGSSSETQDSRLMGTWRLDSTLYFGSGDRRVVYGENVNCEALVDEEKSVQELQFSSQSYVTTDCSLIYNNNTEKYDLFTTAFPLFWITDNDSIYSTLFSPTVIKEDAEAEYYQVNGNKLILENQAFTFGDTLKVNYYTKLN